MKGYPIIGVLWQDHITVIAQELPDDPDSVVELPTLTIGVLVRETDKTLLIAHDVELGTTVSTHSIIYKNAILNRKIYGEIRLEIGGET